MVNFERIEKYLDGELQGFELANFEAELKTNVELSDQLKLHIEVDNAIKNNDIALLKKQLMDIHSSLFIKKKITKEFIHKLNNGWYLMAASIILVALIGTIYLVLLKSSTYSNSDLYNKYYEPYEVVINVRSGNIESNNMFIQALQKYQSKDYTAALSIFEKIIETDSTNAACNFYGGISFMETSKYLKASKSFSSVIRQNDNLFIEQAEWYLGLCYLKINKTSSAKAIFTKIADSKSFYQDKANSLIKNLK
jgi:tetratricopeptide (TPR) repeat protein